MSVDPSTPPSSVRLRFNPRFFEFQDRVAESKFFHLRPVL